MKLFINGENLTKEKDLLGFKIKYEKCLHLKSKKYFLNIQSKIIYATGKYDIWDSSEGDILNLEMENGRLIFEFIDGRYWLIKDEIEENEILDSFLKLHPIAFSVKMESGKVIANFISSIDTFSVVKGKNDYEFRKIKSDVAKIAHNLYDELSYNHEKPAISKVFVEEDKNDTDGIIPCTKECPFQEKGTCTFFDDVLIMGNNMEIEPACGVPILYIEERTTI